MARRFLLSQSKYKKIFLVIKSRSVSIYSFIEHLVLRDGKVHKIFTLLSKLCVVKRGTHPTIIISDWYFSGSIRCVVKRNGPVCLSQRLSCGSHRISKVCTATSSSGQCGFFITVSARQPSFWCFPIASRVDSILTLSFSGPLIWPQLHFQPPLAFQLLRFAMLPQSFS